MNKIKFLLCVVLIGAAAIQAQPQGRQIAIQPQGEYATIDTSGINRAILILAKGSDDEKDALVEKITKLPGDYAPPVFMFMARRLYDKGDAGGAYFWFSFGRLRGRYDAARCADLSARQEIDVMIMNLNRDHPELRKYPLKMKPDDIVPFARRVLKLDRETPRHYDYRWINLNGMNAIIGGLSGGNSGHEALSVPESEWPDLLRKLQDDFLKGAEQIAAMRQGSVQNGAVFQGRDSNFTKFTDENAAALTAAAIGGDVHEIDKLIQEGADPNALSTKGAPLLGCVLLSNGKPGFVALLERHANPGATVGYGHRLPSFWGFAS